MSTKRAFIDSAIKRIKDTDKTGWYSDKMYRRRRPCTTSGLKPWHASKWDGAAQLSPKGRAVPTMKRDEAWRIACEVEDWMHAGEHVSGAEEAAKAIEEDAPWRPFLCT